MNVPRPDDQGSALIITLMVLALLTALATTVSVVTINNLQSAWRAQQSGAALNAAEAGIAQAMSYLRSTGVRALGCAPSCATNPWGNAAAPKSVTVGGGTAERYDVWIEPVVPYSATSDGLYRIHSVGRALGDARRTVSADVRVTTTTIPKGVFARTVSGGGSASVQRESIFSTGCVYNRSKILMSGVDAAYGIPVGVHSSQVITNSNGTGQYCPTTKKPIHDPAKSGSDRNCSVGFPYDQDRLGGGDLGTTGACSQAKSLYPSYYGPHYPDGAGGYKVDGSKIVDDASLLSLFGLRTPVLTQSQLDQLRSIAQSQGNYYTTAAAPAASPKPGWYPDEDNAVLFFDLAQLDPGGVVDLAKVYGFDRLPQPSTCPDRSLVIVIDGGNAKLNSNQSLVASLFLTSAAPYGQVLKVNGTSDFIGTIYGDSVDLTGNTNVSMDSCFLANISPALFDLTLTNYVEEDAG